MKGSRSLPRPAELVPADQVPSDRLPRELSPLPALLPESVLDDAVLDDAVLDDAVLDDAVLDDAVLDDAVLDDAVLDDAVLDDGVLADSLDTADSLDPDGRDEVLVDLTNSPLRVLHSYARAGWRCAVDRQLLRTDLVDRLIRAHAALPDGFGLAVFDAWRPLTLQRELFETIGLSGDGVAPPSSDPATPPPHLTGGAVDLTLSWLGVPLALGTVFDDFGAASAAAAFEDDPGPVRTLRRLLFWSLRAEGLVALAEEWWHFEYGTRLWSAVTGRRVRYGPASPPAARVGKSYGLQL
jgi:zinc D-Ala-D-Ala dipeptidase